MIVSRFSGYRIILRAIVVVMAIDRRDRLPPIDTALVVVPSFSCLSFHVSSHISSRVHVQELKNKSHSRVALEATFRDHFIALRCCRWLVHMRLETLRSKDTYPPPPTTFSSSPSFFSDDVHSHRNHYKKLQQQWRCPRRRLHGLLSKLANESMIRLVACLIAL